MPENSSSNSNSQAMPGFLASAVVGLGSAGINAVSRGGPKRQYKYNKKLAEYQNTVNRANAEWAFEKDMEAKRWQLEYDSPASQMARFKEAGLNPNLIYGQGTPGNMGSAPTFPNVPGVNMGVVDAASLGALGTEFNQARLMAAQTDLTMQKTEESGVRQELQKAQTEVTKANPHLRPGYVDSLVAQLKATADLKKQEASFMLEQVTGTVNGQTVEAPGVSRGYVMMHEQMRNLFTKFELDRKRSANLDEDLKIKAQVIESKEFQNALSQIQVEWMKNGDITPQHIYQAIFMLLQTMMRR